ncbi:hypothetical protein FGRMN_10012 [Fusarium graminum]|nr:hypothetical protein FGRMN_10012 [Fusarium graminum]
MANPQDYTVGWICALTVEFVAAQAFLDEEHEGPQEVAKTDNNNYALGKIGSHNVVIAVLPDKEYGTAVAASVARDMLHSFPNVRIGLMVGIGGGAPSPSHDIRLGDIVVSSRESGTGGVFQYDFGKTIQNQPFQQTGFLDQPPMVLRTAVSSLKAKYDLKGHQIIKEVDVALQRIKKRKKYCRPPAGSDRLYPSNITHPSDSSAGCSAVCGDDSVLSRTERDEEDDDPAIHYGLIASSNQLMKDAFVRDRLAAEKGVLCFEMEAAGLMNHFPCLVIRGICDYSDSHKNKEWQGYAAMVAAAYARDLLNRIAPDKVEAEKKLGDILSGLHEIAEDHRDVAREHYNLAKEQLQAQKDLAKDTLPETQKCHQLFRLTTSSKDTTYEWYKDRVEQRIENTCMWFLNHNHFQEWLKQDSGPLLVTADPGCGKSVLAKYLIDHGLPRSTTICYFFFKEQDQNTVPQALCALLHQLFSLKPSLIGHAMPLFRTEGDGLINSTNSLWQILRNAISDPQAGSITVVLDALDECAESEFQDLMQNIDQQFRKDEPGCGRLKYLLTCRPYDQLMWKFCGMLDRFPNVRIPGEEESETIAQEVNHVITCRVNQLATEQRLSPEIKHYLEKRLQEITHRTYLWIYLVFNYLSTEVIKKTQKGVEAAIATLPMSINEAYQQILDKATGAPLVRKVLKIILAANRPLTLSEMNIATNVDYTLHSTQDLDLEDDDDLRTRLRSWCGLFVSIHHGNIYLIHQTAREFLLVDSTLTATISKSLSWHQSFTTQEAETLLAELCILYLDALNSDVDTSRSEDRQAGGCVDRFAFRDYSAQNWIVHFRRASIDDDANILPFAVRICNPNSISYTLWSKWNWAYSIMRSATAFTDLMIASYHGLDVLVKALLDTSVDIEARDSEYGRTALFWAVWYKHEAIVKLLLDRGADVEARDNNNWAPLQGAMKNEDEAILKLLLEKGADPEANNNGWTPLLWATGNRNEALVKMLLEYGADVEVKDRDYGKTPMLWAKGYKNGAIMRLLFEHGANP